MTSALSVVHGDETFRRIPLSSADISAAERKQVEAAIEGGWISGTGPQVRELEERLAARINRAHVIATANGTLAIELALRALGIGSGDEVVVPALTFAAPTSSVLAVGATQSSQISLQTTGPCALMTSRRRSLSLPGPSLPSMSSATPAIMTL
jgi:selenocysteine lyase/cysteine desulfurase